MRRWLWVGLFALIITIALAGIKFFQIKKAIAFGASFPEQTETVSAAMASAAQWTPTVNAVGEVLAPQNMVLRNELAGRVVEIGFESGAPVRAGQLLVRQDTSQEQAQLAAVQARSRLAQAQLKRLKKLAATSSASADQVDEASANLAVAKADAQALSAQINKKTLIANFDGMAGLHTLEIGEHLAANTEITQLVGTRRALWVDFSLAQQQNELAIGTIVSIKLAGSNLPAEVIAKAPSLNTGSRNRQYRALISNSGDLPAGAIVDVLVPVAAAKTVVTVPAGAVRRDGFGSHVFVIVSKLEGTEDVLRAHRREVTLGKQDGQEIIVQSGVEAGERVAALGAFKLRDGMRVRLSQ